MFSGKKLALSITITFLIANYQNYQKTCASRVCDLASSPSTVADRMIELPASNELLDEGSSLVFDVNTAEDVTSVNALSAGVSTTVHETDGTWHCEVTCPENDGSYELAFEANGLSSTRKKLYVEKAGDDWYCSSASPDAAKTGLYIETHLTDTQKALLQDDISPGNTHFAEYLSLQKEINENVFQESGCGWSYDHEPGSSEGRSVKGRVLITHDNVSVPVRFTTVLLTSTVFQIPILETTTDENGMYTFNATGLSFQNKQICVMAENPACNVKGPFLNKYTFLLDDRLIATEK